MAREMEVILTHENTDFDALASLLGAAKLYHQAKPVVPRRPNRNLRDFLTLYWDELPFFQHDELPRGSIRRVILVDTQVLPHLRGMSHKTEVHIIDHHPLSRELEEGMTYSGGDTGANATILVEQISQANISLSPIEATLLLLGIYEDTGSLSYPATTPRDLHCAAWLLEQGASLEVVNDFLHHPLTEEQRQLYNQLLENSQSFDFAGHSVIIATATVPDYVEEISTLAHRLRDIFDPAALFLLVEMDDHIQFVARSSSEAIDVAQIAAHLDGGGHGRAAAALIRGRTLADTRQRLLDLLQEYIKPTVTVGQIMSYGVHTLSPETTVAEAEEIMRRYGHEGFPVVENGQVVGTLTRREIDKALHHRLGGAAIRLYMHTGDVSVSPEDSVARLQQVMMEHGLGQVPVVEGGEVIGIVTRTDLIKLWSTPPPERPRTTEIAQLIERALPAPLLKVIQTASQTASQMGYSLYFVGGFVRDLLLGTPTLDIDLVVEGDAIKLARRLSHQIGGRVRGHARFGTAKLIFDEAQRELSVPSIDFVAARTEFYEHPTALPQVERSSIKLDLHRRDFTINTLAIRLDPEHYGELLDFYGGEQDLKDGLIRVLHSLSFVEDPTRMLRAARLEQRLGFKIEERTEELIGNALGLLDRVSGERIRHELYLIFQEAEPEKGLCRLEDLGVLTQIHPALRCNDWLSGKYRLLREALEAGDWKLGSGEQATPIHYLALLTYRLISEELETLIRRLKITRDDADRLREVGELRPIVPRLAERDLSPSAIYQLLAPFSGQSVFLMWVASDSGLIRQRLELYHRRLQYVKPEIDGAWLQERGVEPGPIYRQILGALRDARLDGQVSSLREEEALFEKLLAEAAAEGTGEG
jgi:tRNA nucleotidyltransferase (CCA-adding enzyme)